MFQFDCCVVCCKFANLTLLPFSLRVGVDILNWFGILQLGNRCPWLVHFRRPHFAYFSITWCLLFAKIGSFRLEFLFGIQSSSYLLLTTKFLIFPPIFDPNFGGILDCHFDWSNFNFFWVPLEFILINSSKKFHFWAFWPITQRIFWYFIGILIWFRVHFKRFWPIDSILAAIQFKFGLVVADYRFEIIPTNLVHFEFCFVA